MKDLFSVEGKSVLVTGGSRGVGAMIARGLVERGAHVILSSRDAEACRKTAEDLSAFGKVSAVAADVSTTVVSKRSSVPSRTSLTAA